MAFRIKLKSPAGEVQVLDLAGIKDVTSLSAVVCRAFGSLARGDHRVVGFELPSGIVLVPSLVLQNVAGYASRGLRVVLDTELSDGDDDDDGNGVEPSDESKSVSDDVSDGNSSDGADAPVSPEPQRAEANPPAATNSVAHVVRGQNQGFPLRFDLFPGDTVGLSFTAAAVSDLFSLVVGTNLCGLAVKDVASRFLESVSGPQLSKASYHAIIQALVPRELLTSTERKTFSALLNALFSLYARGADANSVDTAELMAGFTLLCAGNKSTKLAVAFGLFDADNDGYLSRRELWKFLRAFLTALFTFSGSRVMVEGNESQVATYRSVAQEVIDDTAVEATHLVFAAVDPSGKRLSFDEFGGWYNTGGYLVLPWLELLDLKKWPKNVTLSVVGSQPSQGPIVPPPGIPPRPTASGQASAKPAVAASATPKPPPAVRSTVVPPPPPTASPSAPAAPTNDLVFHLSADCDPLVLTPVDVRRFLDFLSASGLSDARPNALIRELLRVEKDGTILPQDYLTAVNAMVSPAAQTCQFSSTYDMTVLDALKEFFACFDLYGGEVDATEFMAGFLLLAAGTKSDKLSVAYSLFDTAGSGKLSRRSLWKFLRSFLTALASVSSSCSDLDTEELQRLVDAGAVEITADVFLKAARESKDQVTFDEFGGWYNSGGYLQAPWLELLDHSKWSPKPASPAVAAAPQPKAAVAPPAPPKAAATTKPESAASSTVLLQFSLTAGGSSNAPALQLTVADCARLSQTLALTKLNTVDPEYMHTLFNTRTHDGMLSKSDFDHCIRQLVPGAALTQQQRSYLTVVLSTMYYVYAAADDDAVPFNEFSTGFSVLASGSKSEKLSLAFRLFDDDEDGSLNRKQLFLFLRSFLTLLATLHEPFAKLERSQLHTLLTSVASDFTDCVFSLSQRAKSGLITYEEFGRWYNGGGHTVAPWLELLDLSKWPLAPSALVAAAPAAASVEEPDDAVAEDSDYEYMSSDGSNDEFIPTNELQEPAELTEDTDDDAASTASAVVFEFPLVSGQSVVRLSTTDVRHLKFIARGTAYSSMSPADVIACIKACSRNGVLHREGFDVFTASTAPGASSPASGTSYLGLALNNLFYAFDREDDGSVDTSEFAAAFTLLARGSKSDKLVEAFALFDAAGRGRLSKLALWKFVRALLTFLGGIVSITHTLTDDTLSAAAVDRGAIEITSTIFREASLSERDSISYEEFGMWYNDGGFKVIPWLELLDLKKWPSVFTQPDSVVATDEEASSDEAEAANPAKTVFTFTLAKDVRLAIAQADCDHVAKLASVTGLFQLSLKSLYYALTDEADPDSGLISRHGFAAALRTVISSGGMTTEQQQDFGETLSTLFTALAYLESSQSAAGNPESGVEVASLVVAMSLLVAGSKSDKLSLGFHAFDDSDASDDADDIDASGYLTKASLCAQLTAVLVAIQSLQLGSSSLKTICNTAVAGAYTVASAVFAQAARAGANVVTYEEFGGWYNGGGFEVVPWLELLDLKKWPSDIVIPSLEPTVAPAPAAAPAAASAASAGSALQLVFPLNTAGDALVVTPQDYAFVQRLLEFSRLGRVEADELHALFDSEASSGVLSRDGFNACLDRAVPLSALPQDKRDFLNFAFSTLFAAFDSNGDGEVDEAEFSAGFSVLAAGSKSDKLSLAFRLFDTDADGTLTQSGLISFLRGFVNVLCALASVKVTTSLPLPDLVFVTAAQVASRVFNDLGLSSTDTLSYEEFGNWYNGGGFKVVPWLELLDLKKWASVAQASTAPQPTPTPQVAAAESEEGSPPIAPLEPFVITADDVASLERFLSSSKLGAVSPARLQDAFLSQVGPDGASLKKAGFDKAIRELIPGSALTSAERAFLSQALTNLFYAFDTDGSGAVDFAEFLAGFSLLSSGAKSDKLALAFRLFDEDDDGYISLRELHRYLRSFLTTLCALQKSFHAALTPDTLASIDASAAELAVLIMESSDIDNDGVISFEEFGLWYNEGGYEVVPWLELLDLKKWPVAAAAAATKAAPAPKATGSKAALKPLATDAAATKPLGVTPTPTSHVTLFAFPLADGAALNIRRQDVRNLSRLLQLTGLASVDPDTIITVFMSATSPDGSLSKSAYDEALSQLVPASVSTSSDGPFVAFAFDNIFYAFDHDGSGVVRSVQLAAGFSVLSGGCKSDKLSLAYRLLDSDGDGLLSHDELVEYLAAFLTLLCALRSDAIAETDAQTAALATAIRHTAGAVASQIESVADDADDGVSYDAFGSWYNSVGFKMVPWLELLDLKKWPSEAPVVAPVAAAATTDDDDADDSDAEEAADTSDEDAEEEDEEDAGVAESGAEAGNVVFLFKLVDSADGGAGDALALTFEDCAVYQRARGEASAGVAATTVRSAFDAFFQPESTLGALGLHQDMYLGVAQSVFGDSGAASLGPNLSTVISNAFALYALIFPGQPSLSNFAEIVPCVAGVLALATGSKSDKLSVAFRLFDKDGDDRLNPRDLQTFFASFLAWIASLSKSCRSLPASTLGRLVLDTAASAVTRILQSEFVARPDSVSFVEFGEWYNAIGHKFVPWIELLDTRKWPDVLSDNVGGEENDDDDDDEDYDPNTDSDASEDGDSDVDDDANSDDAADDADNVTDENDDVTDDAVDPPVFLFALYPSATPAKLSRSDLNSALSVLASCGLPDLKLSDIAAALLPLLPSSGVSSGVFDEAISKLLGVSALSDADQDAVTSFFSRVYFAVASLSGGAPTPDVVLVATAVFGGGSKSDKLAFAFKRLCSASADGMSADDLTRYLTCFLAPLLSMSASASQDGAEVFRRKVKSTVSSVVKEIFGFVAGNATAAGGTGDSIDTSGGDKVTFADFGHWYNVDGHTIVPWIELLDVRKWKAIADR